MGITAAEKQYLRNIAKQLTDISLDPKWDKKKRLWKNINALKKTRPLVLSLVPEQAWQELIPEGNLHVSDVSEGLYRGVEFDIQRKLYKSALIKDDEILNNILYVPIAHSLTDWIDEHKRPYSADANRSGAFEPCIREYGDIKKLRMPELTVDWRKTNEDFEKLSDIFGDILDVRIGEPFIASSDLAIMGRGHSLIDILCELRGLDNVFYDMIDAPEFVHEMMSFLMAGYSHYLDQMEQENILRLNNNEYVRIAITAINSNGLGCVDELPAGGFDAGHVRTTDLWGYSQAQDLTLVSPEMLEEFVLPYQSKLSKRFGLNCYGCCENNDRKWDLITESIPRLRELSVSAFSDLKIAVAKLEDKYVISWKVNPTLIMMFDEVTATRVLRDGFESARGCCLVVSARDTMTLNSSSKNIAHWTDIAVNMAHEYG